MTCNLKTTVKRSRVKLIYEPTCIQSSMRLNQTIVIRPLVNDILNNVDVVDQFIIDYCINHQQKPTEL